MIQGGSFLVRSGAGSRVLQRSSNAANTNGGVACANTNYAPSNVNVNTGSRLEFIYLAQLFVRRKLSLTKLHLGEVKNGGKWEVLLVGFPKNAIPNL